MSRTHLKLHGQFKVDVFDASGNFLRSSDYIKNFITNSGTLYPYYFAFADCFRYLSLGSGINVPNSTGVIGFPATTGLASGVSGYQYVGFENYTTGGFLGGGCGNFADPNSNTISLIRQWALPDITGGTFDSTVDFSEIMVSPGRPYVTGFADAGKTQPTGLCGCNEVGYSSLSAGQPDLTGLDCSEVQKYYSLLPSLNEQADSQYGTVLRERLKLCDANAAFARITGNFTVNSGEILTITYKLNLSFSTGVQEGAFFVPDSNTISNIAPDNNWSGFGFVANITNPGIKLIVDSQISQNNYSVYAPTDYRLQHFDFRNEQALFSEFYGESFIPSLGIPMEPSCVYGDGGNLVAYISDDNTQFFASPSGGACITGLFQPWNPTGLVLPRNSGLMGFRTLVSGNNSIEAINFDSDFAYWTRNPFNIRTSSSSQGYPDTGNIENSISAIIRSPSTYSGAQSRSRFTSGSRGGSILTNYNFPFYLSNNHYGDSLYARSYVIAYVDSRAIYNKAASFGNSVYCDLINSSPVLDCLLSGLSGSSVFLPQFYDAGSVGNPTGQILGSDDVSYNYFTGQDGSLNPSIQSLLSWTADCPPDAMGC